MRQITCTLACTCRLRRLRAIYLIDNQFLGIAPDPTAPSTSNVELLRPAAANILSPQ